MKTETKMHKTWGIDIQRRMSILWALLAVGLAVVEIFMLFSAWQAGEPPGERLLKDTFNLGLLLTAINMAVFGSEPNKEADKLKALIVICVALGQAALLGLVLGRPESKMWPPAVAIGVQFLYTLSSAFYLLVLVRHTDRERE